MKIIGVKRTIILAALVAGNLFLAAAYLLWAMPMRDNAELELQSMRNQISGLQNQIQNIKQEIVTFNETLPRYRALEGRGFYSTQDRFLISRTLDDLRVKAGIPGFSFNIDTIKEVENADALSAGLKLMHTRVTIDNMAILTDDKFFALMDILQKQYPAHLRFNGLELRRGMPLSEQVLQQVASGENVALMSGKLVFDWLTLVPTPQDIDPNAVPAGGAM